MSKSPRHSNTIDRAGVWSLLLRCCRCQIGRDLAERREDYWIASRMTGGVATAGPVEMRSWACWEERRFRLIGNWMGRAMLLWGGNEK